MMGARAAGRDRELGGAAAGMRIDDRTTRMVRAMGRGLAWRLRETRAATGLRFPLVAARWLVRREYLVTGLPVVAPAGAPAMGGGARWSRVEDVDALPAARPLSPGERLEMRHRLAEGQECWVAWLDGEPAHWRWESTGPAWLPYLGRRFHPAAGDLLVVDVYTAPRFRGRGLHTAATQLACQRARARGLARLVGLVAWWNEPARRVMEVKTARTVVGTVGFWHLGLTRRYFAGGDVRLTADGVVLARAAAPAAPMSSRGAAGGARPR